MSSNMSVGQILGTVAGAVIGAFIPGGYIALGASIGGMIGGAIDPPKGPQIEGPRLNDRKVQVSSYGEVVPDVFGTAAIAGNVFWVENNELKETAKTEGGGKGGGGPETTTYTYSSTFAVALCTGPIEGVRRIWIGSKLLYDAAASDLATVMAAETNAEGWRVYHGTADQMPDPRMEAALGAGNCPAYRGIAYIVFYDLQLADYGNSLLGAQVRVEVISDATVDNTMPQVAHWALETSPAVGFTADIFENVIADEISSTSYDVKLYENATRIRTIVNQGYVGLPGAASYDMLGLFGRTNTPEHKLWVEGVAYADYEAIYSQAKSIHKMRKAEFDGRVWHYAILSDSSTDPDGRRYLARLSLGIYESSISRMVRLDLNEFAFIGDQFGSVLKNLSPPYETRIRLYDGNLEQTTEVVFASAPNFSYWGPGGSGAYHLDQAYCAWYSGSCVYVADGNSLAPGIAVFDLSTGLATQVPLAGTTSFGGLISLRAYPGGIIKMSGLDYASPHHVHVWAPPPISSAQVTLASIVEALCLKSRLDAADIDVTELESDYVRGYIVASAGTLRAAIEPLQAVWPFDVIQHGYNLKFVRRPNASALTIPESDLGAIAGNDAAAIRLTEAREMDGQLPRRVSIRYPDIDREYDTNEQYDERLNTDAINQRILDIPVVMTATEAAGVAQQLLYRAWVERSEYQFVLPPANDYRKIEPTDIVTVQAVDAQHGILISGAQTLPDGRIEITGKRNDTAVYSPTAVGVTGTVVPSTIASKSKTEGILLDIPMVHYDQNSPSILAAMRGVSGWNGGSLFASRDEGATWVFIADLSSGSMSTVGYCDTILAAPVTTAMVDTSSTLTINLVSGTLSSVSRTQLLNGANSFAIGAEGRWELVQAQTAVEISAGIYKLSNFLRGRMGTEWAAGTHQAGDAVVLLDETRIAWGRLQSSDFDTPLLWRFVTHGSSADTAREITGTYAGVNLECLSPIRIRGHKTAAGDLVVSATRRTRYDGVWRDYADVPLNEVSERYDAEIYGEAGFTTVKRTFSGLTSPEFTYTAAQQTTDFGSVQFQYNLRLYQLSEKRGRGYPAQKSLGFMEPYWGNVSIALHCDGTNGSTALIDEKGNTWTHLGGTNKIITSESKFGGACAGRTSSQSTGWSTPATSGMEFGSGNLTVEFFFKNFGGSNQYIFWQGTLPSTPDWFVLMSGLSANFAYNSAGTTYYISKGAQDFSTWKHVAWVRNGATDKIYVDGVEVFSQASFGAIRATSGATNYFCGADGTIKFDAYVDDVRVTKGVARYTAAFTPPSSQFTS